MKLRKSHMIAGLIALAVIAYFLLSAIFRGGGEGQEANVESQADKIPLVTVKDSRAQPHPRVVEIRGRTEPERTVVVRAETSGRVMRLPVAEGAYVKAGQVICTLEVRARQAQLDQAQANLKARDLEYQAALKLQEKGFRSENATQAVKAARDAALAGVRVAQAELENTRLRAPFSGILDSLPVDKGDLLSPGQPCGTVVDLNPIVIVGNVTEVEAQSLKAGQSAQAELSTGEVVTGKIAFVAKTPDDTTKTFRVEINVPNPNAAVPSGALAITKISVGETMAHQVPPAILALNADGDVGMRILDNQNIVHFKVVTVLDEKDQSMWVAGLPDQARIITVGQDYVKEGKQVRTQDNSDATAVSDAAE